MAETLHFPLLYRGDTLPGRTIARISQGGAPLALTSARMQIRQDRGDALVHEWTTTAGSMTISGAGQNEISLDTVPKSITALWPVGLHRYDLEVTFAASGETRTILEGTLEVKQDVTR